MFEVLGGLARACPERSEGMPVATSNFLNLFVEAFF
jgi:hypothetical protein